MANRRPKWMMTKAESAKLHKKFAEVMKRMKASGEKGIFGVDYTFGIGYAGSVTCGMHEDGDTIYCKFKNPSKAAKCVPGVNPYSGKWNFHFGREHTAEKAISSFYRAVSLTTARCTDD